METKRKLQLGALVVVANSLLALTVMAPRPALANPCTPIYACLGPCGPTYSPSKCQNIAKPGCTYTSYTCTPGQCPPSMISPATTCYYN